MLCKRRVKGGHGQVGVGWSAPNGQRGAIEPRKKSKHRGNIHIYVQNSDFLYRSCLYYCVCVCVCVCVYLFKIPLPVVQLPFPVIFFTGKYIIPSQVLRMKGLWDSPLHWGGAVGFECTVSHTQPSGSPDWRWQREGGWVMKGRRSLEKQNP